MHVAFVIHGGFHLMHVVDPSCLLRLQEMTRRHTLCVY